MMKNIFQNRPWSTVITLQTIKALRQPRESPQNYCLRTGDWCGHLSEANEEEEEENRPISREELLIANRKLKFRNAIFRDDWSESNILPLFRKGTVNDPKHYRGCVIDVVSCAVPL